MAARPRGAATQGVLDPLLGQITYGMAADALNGQTTVPYGRPEPSEARMIIAKAKLAI